jgi:hypothetical protein
MFATKELHAWEFVSGRGRLGPRIVPKGRRIAIYRQKLRLIAQMDALRCFCACFPKTHKLRAFERLVNRINRTMASWDSHAILFCDEGSEGPYTKLLRRMRRYNPIPSRFGRWGAGGTTTRNIPTERIVEDPVFKRSERSYLIQAADFVAYALLRRERPMGPTQ